MRLACRTAVILSILILAQSPSLAANSSSTGTPTNANWTEVNANANGTNHVEQGQIAPDNVNQLTKKWVFSIPPASPVAGLDLLQNGSISPPLSINGTVYIVTSYLRIYALDSADGALLWSYQAQLNRTGLPVSHLTGHTHGLIYYRGDIWVSLPDCSVIGVGATSGKLDRHITGICAGIPGNSGLYDSSGVPPVFRDHMMIWVSSVSEGTDVGRGFVAAYNLTTGTLLWRWFVTPPAGGDPLWDQTSCPVTSCHGNVAAYIGDWGIMGSQNHLSLAGAGPAFGQPAVDEKRGVVYVATSQPSPDWNATYRPGPNLYSDSVVALNVTNGRMLWFFQSTPHDLFDFDCGWNVVLGNAVVDGQNKTVVFKGCKNGYLYALDASTGSLLWYFNPPSVKRVGTPNANYVVTGNYDATQRWIDYPSTSVFEQCPGANGALESDIAFAYNLVFVATYNLCAFGMVTSVDSYGASHWGVRQLEPAASQANTTIYAVNASTGQVVWSHFLPKIPYRGWLTVSNGVLYAGALDGYIHAFDDRMGREIFAINVGVDLYESPTVGSASNGGTLLLQLTSPSSYGVFSANQTGYLIAYGLPQAGAQYLSYALYAALGAGAAVLTLFTIFRLTRSRGSPKGTGPR
ncbi:MAG: hypothetical protein E6K96_02250 [Thaumarchaeota archaeon]|nr:MAG: hypothetical protein E6K96_02250 [Nitrososphaerota archaeon]